LECTFKWWTSTKLVWTKYQFFSFYYFQTTGSQRRRKGTNSPPWWHAQDAPRPAHGEPAAQAQPLAVVPVQAPGAPLRRDHRRHRLPSMATSTFLALAPPATVALRRCSSSSRSRTTCAASHGTGHASSTVASPSSTWWARASHAASLTPSRRWGTQVRGPHLLQLMWWAHLVDPSEPFVFPAGTMALSSSPQRIALAVFGLVAFILGVVAENKRSILFCDLSTVSLLCVPVGVGVCVRQRVLNKLQTQVIFTS
jgi:hypothetical protein